MQQLIRRMEGVISTRVGYSGGERRTPPTGTTDQTFDLATWCLVGGSRQAILCEMRFESSATVPDNCWQG